VDLHDNRSRTSPLTATSLFLCFHLRRFHHDDALLMSLGGQFRLLLFSLLPFLCVELETAHWCDFRSSPSSAGFLRLFGRFSLLSHWPFGGVFWLHWVELLKARLSRPCPSSTACQSCIAPLRTRCSRLFCGLWSRAGHGLGYVVLLTLLEIPLVWRYTQGCFSFDCGLHRQFDTKSARMWPFAVSL
jgi:hypothetical protein